MKKIIFGAMAAVALLACSKDQVIEQNRANDEITFSVVAENQTKAAAVYCANHMIGEFYVYATHDNAWYFQNDHIKNVDGKWLTEGNTRYWGTGSHDFYAILNGEMTVTGVDKTPETPYVDFTTKADVNDQVDLVYAVATDYTKDMEKAVALNFRHALSQIEFKAKNTNEHIYVVVEGVKVGKAYSTGRFTFPTTSTAEQYVDHDQSGAANPALNTGVWSAWGNQTDYTVEGLDVAVANGETQNLTISVPGTTDEKSEFSKSMLLIPANTTAWTPAARETDYDGTYLAVKCRIYNVAGTAYAASDVQIHTGWAVMPVAFNWEPGKKYIYTFVFGDGNGGYEPDPENPEPVLTPISYTVTVDDFQKGVDSDVNMEY